MRKTDLLAIAAPSFARNVGRWIYALGGLGFIPLGLLDNSVIPLPGSMDILTIFLSTKRQRLWLYYTSMATLGSVIGGFVTYRLARKGGKETLTRRFPAKKLEKAYDLLRDGALARLFSRPCCHHPSPWSRF